jgi:hypothetical protein
MEFTITVERAAETATKLNQVAMQMDDLSARELENGLNRLLVDLTEEVKDRTPHFTGGLEASIFNEIRVSGQSLEGLVSTPLVYGPPIEFGRKPGKMPPVDALKSWAARKLGDEKLAFVVARAIARKGYSSLQHTDKQQMFQDAWDQNQSLIEQHLTDLHVHVSEALLKTL